MKQKELNLPEYFKLEVVEIEGSYYVLDGWNGEVWTNCWEIDNLGNSLSNETYEIRPIYSGVGEPDKDGDFEQYEITDYEII